MFVSFYKSFSFGLYELAETTKGVTIQHVNPKIVKMYLKTNKFTKFIIKIIYTLIMHKLSVKKKLNSST